MKTEFRAGSLNWGYTRTFAAHAELPCGCVVRRAASTTEDRLRTAAEVAKFNRRAEVILRAWLVERAAAHVCPSTQPEELNETHSAG